MKSRILALLTVALAVVCGLALPAHADSTGSDVETANVINSGPSYCGRHLAEIVNDEFNDGLGTVDNQYGSTGTYAFTGGTGSLCVGGSEAVLPQGWLNGHPTLECTTGRGQTTYTAHDYGAHGNFNNTGHVVITLPAFESDGVTPNDYCYNYGCAKLGDCGFDYLVGYWAARTRLQSRWYTYPNGWTAWTNLYTKFCFSDGTCF